MHSISDITTAAHRTSGEIPPKLVGATTTVVGDKMYVFGGRLVTERRMITDLYMIDLNTLVWKKLVPPQGAIVPAARYFHSADAWNNKLVIFGGMGHQTNYHSAGRDRKTEEDELFVLNDVWFFDLATQRWSPSVPLHSGSATPSEVRDPFESVPRGRYAHLSAITSTHLFVVGGQDLENQWLDDICVFDLANRNWVQRKEYPRHTGTYRSVAVAGEWKVRTPDEEPRGEDMTPPTFKIEASPRENEPFSKSESLQHDTYSTTGTDEYPNEIYLYSNYNFTDVKRELEVFTPLPDAQNNFTIKDRSSSMSGSCPPGLRFPSGAICGSHMVFGGVYLSQSVQCFSTWALDLRTMTWARIDPGPSVTRGSWFRGCLWATPAPSMTESTTGPDVMHANSSFKSKFLIFGDRDGDLVEDYNRRLLSWTDVIIIDLEVFGIYHHPCQSLDIPSQHLGLRALEEGVFTDFELVCDDGRQIPCSRAVLEARWPWFKERRRNFEVVAARTVKLNTKSNANHAAHPSTESSSIYSTDTLPTDPNTSKSSPPSSRPNSPTSIPLPPNPSLTPRSLQLTTPYCTTLAFLQYLYSLALITPLQRAPAVLSQLLILSTAYDLPHLKGLVMHAMHGMLGPSTSLGVYEMATLCGCEGLQIRALKFVMSSTRAASRSTSSQAVPQITKSSSASNLSTITSTTRSASNSVSRPSVNANDNPNDSGYGSGPGAGNSTTTGGRGLAPDHVRFGAARPRGMSDVRSIAPAYRTAGLSTGSSHEPSSRRMNTNGVGHGNAGNVNVSASATMGHIGGSGHSPLAVANGST